MDSNHIKFDKSQQIEKLMITPIQGFACFSPWHYAQFRHNASHFISTYYTRFCDVNYSRWKTIKDLVVSYEDCSDKVDLLSDKKTNCQKMVISI